MPYAKYVLMDLRQFQMKCFSVRGVEWLCISGVMEYQKFQKVTFFATVVNI